MTKTNPESQYFKHHIFFCLNQRPSNEECCANHVAQEAFDHCKKTIKDLGLNGAGSVRVNKAGCMDRCAGGPVLVVYPEGTWYTYLDNSDIDEIIHSHLTNNKVVDRLLLAPDIGR